MEFWRPGVTTPRGTPSQLRDEGLPTFGGLREWRSVLPSMVDLSQPELLGILG